MYLRTIRSVSCDQARARPDAASAFTSAAEAQTEEKAEAAES